MTENNSEFTQEPSVGNSGDVGQETKQTDVLCGDTDTEPCLRINHSPDYKRVENDPTEETCSKLSNSGCEEESNLQQDHWLKFGTFLRKFYRTILDGEKPPDEYECHVNIVRELVASDPHQLFARLEMDLQEFIIEFKLRLMELLNYVHTDEGPHLFIFCLIEGYNKLMFAAYTLSPLLLQLEVEHLANFGISWRALNQHLFHKLVYTEPKIQKVLPLCISKLGKVYAEISDFNKRLIRQFLTFDDEMTKVGAKWREGESAIIKYHQENSMLDAKWRMTKMNWDLMKTQTNVFHEELESSGISSDVSPHLLNDGEVENSKDVDCLNCADDREKSPAKDSPSQLKTWTDNLKKMKVDLEMLQDQQLCDCCHLSATQCSSNSAPLDVESFMEMRATQNCSYSHTWKDAEILAHLNADGKKMYSHLNKFKAQQTTNGGKVQRLPSTGVSKDTVTSCCEQLPNSNTQSSSPPSSELQKTLIRKQVIHEQRQQHHKKLMQMMQSSQQKDIQQKIQKQLQEHQLLLQQQRKIDELHAHLLQQRPVQLDKEAQKNVFLRVQHRLFQKHQQVEEKFHHQVQQYIQQHQDKPTNLSSILTGNYTKPLPLTSITNQKSAVMPNSVPTNSSPLITSVSSATVPVTSSTVASVSSPKTVTTNTNAVSTGVTHKNSTTQTTAANVIGTGNGGGSGQNRARHHPLPDVVKSTSYICPKHGETNKQNGADNHADYSYSSDDSDEDDFDWDSSSSPQRHCDCCYCEVFGSAPVSRNYQETRERLRLLLTKKKARSIAAAVGADCDRAMSEPSVAASGGCNHAVGSTQPAASQGANKTKKEEVAVHDKKANPTPEYKGDKSIEEILDFIEGNKSRNTKRTAKKMRRKQRQLEEEERRKKEEAERLRQEELRRKEEEEKRRLEEERRKQELLREQNRKKNKKKQAKLEKQAASKMTSGGKKTKSDKGQNPATTVNNKMAQSAKNNQKQNVSKNTLQRQTINQQQQSTKAVSNQTTKRQEPAAPSKQNKGQKVVEKAKQTPPTQNNNSSQKKGAQPSKSPKNGNGKPNDDSGQPQMVTIKRVMQPNSSEPTVTITLRGPTPKEDKVLYTLLNGQMCQVKNDKDKKQPTGPVVTNSKKGTKTSTGNSHNNSGVNVGHVVSTFGNPVNVNNYHYHQQQQQQPSMQLQHNDNYFSVSGAASITATSVPPRTINYNRNCGVIGNGVNSITERMERLKLGPQPAPAEPMKQFMSSATAPQAELTTPTAIQINQAVNQLSSRPTFPNNFDLENIKLPPGITITKVDPATVQRKPIQVKQSAPPPPPPPPPAPQSHIRQTMMPAMGGPSNVIVVDTSDRNHYHSDETVASAGKKKRRRRKKENGEMSGGAAATEMMSGSALPYHATNGFSPRIGSGLYGNPFVNAAGYGNMIAQQQQPQQQQQQPAAIIQLNGSMVTIRNPALHQALSGGGAQPKEYLDGTKTKKVQDAPRNPNLNENVFPVPPEEVENGDVDEYERELEAFKRFCSQSVPAESKAKVNLNIEDIVLKKKGPVIGCS